VSLTLWLLQEVHLGADELVPVLCYVVAHAKLRHLPAQADYMRASFGAYFSAGGVEDHALTMFESAVYYLSHEFLSSARSSVSEEEEGTPSRRPSGEALSLRMSNTTSSDFQVSLDSPAVEPAAE